MEKHLECCSSLIPHLPFEVKLFCHSERAAAGGWWGEPSCWWNTQKGFFFSALLNQDKARLWHFIYPEWLVKLPISPELFKQVNWLVGAKTMIRYQLLYWSMTKYSAPCNVLSFGTYCIVHWTRQVKCHAVNHEKKMPYIFNPAERN